jgi:hypothetical protein
MNARITETVALPDPEVQPLVHPLDLPDARRNFRLAYWVRTLTSPGTALVIAAITWFYDASWVRPVFIFAVLVILGHFAVAWSDRQAWSFIPRKRQDRARPLPFEWDFTASLIRASLFGFGIAVLVSTLSLGRPYLDDGINEYVVGMGAVAAALSIIVLGIRLARGKNKRSAAFDIPPTLAVALGVLFAYWALFREYEPSWPDLLTGASIMLVAGILVGIWKLIEQRRSHETA